MNTLVRAVCAVWPAGFLAAIPPAWLLGDGQPIAVTAWAALAGTAASVWLWVLVRSGPVKRLTFGTGAVVGLLSVLTVVVTSMFFMPNTSADWRAFYVTFSTAYVGVYAIFAGGLLALLIRGTFLPSANLLP